MTGHLKNLIDTLREELLQYGEMLARLDDHRQNLPSNEAATTPALSPLVQQGRVMRGLRSKRGRAQRTLARQLRLPQQGGVREMILRLPPSYRPLVTALVEECDRLSRVVTQHGRPNGGCGNG